EDPPADPQKAAVRGVPWRLCSYLHRADSGGLGALRAVADLELDLLVFFKGAEAASLDLRVVDKHIRGTVLGGNEPEPLLRVEPLHSSLWHFSIFPFLVDAVHRVSMPRARRDRHYPRGVAGTSPDR